MASSFARWEKDPFFSAAEEVQQSADRMESAYRTWIHATKDASSIWNCDELRRDLRTTLGTTKWQLDEFERAVKSSYIKTSNEDARERHREFIIAIEEQIAKTEKALKESALSEGKAPIPWVRLDEVECDELALFLSGMSASDDKSRSGGMNNENPQVTKKEPVPDCSNNSQHSTEHESAETRKEKLHGHRRTASANTDSGVWKIAISEGNHQQGSFDGQPNKLIRKIPSVSGFLNSVESASKIKWPKNGVRKWKATDRKQEADSVLLPSPQLTTGLNACYERNKSCLDSCDDCYNKQLYSWHGAIQRRLQRSQYYMQYSRPLQITFTVFVLLIVFVVFHTV